MMLIDGELSNKNDNVLSSSGTELLNLCNQQTSRNQRLLSQRKIKSRDAARNRRGKENYEFYELAKLLPIPEESATQLDKASIIRLTMCFLQVREIYSSSKPDWKLADEGPPPNRTVEDTSEKLNSVSQQAAVSKMVEENLGSHVLQSLDGFMMVLNCHGSIVYVSETVSLFLGLSQVEMIGSSLFEYTCSDDTNELALNLGLSLSSLHDKDERLNSEGGEPEANCTRSFFIRMRSALAKRGMWQKSSCFKVVHLCTRTQRNILNCSRKGFARSSDESSSSSSGLKSETTGIVAFGTTLPSYNISGLPLHENVFVMRANSSLQITYCEVMVENFFGYTVQEILGKSLYQCVHAADIKRLKSSHVDLLSKDHVETPYIRWLHKFKGYRWICSSVMLMPNQRVYPERSFIWIHTVISDIINNESVIDQGQPQLEKTDVAQTFLITAVENEKEQKVASEIPNHLNMKNGAHQVAKTGDEIDSKSDESSSKFPDTDQITQEKAKNIEVLDKRHLRKTEHTSEGSNDQGSSAEATAAALGSRESEIPAKRLRIETAEESDAEHKSRSQQIPRAISRDPKYDARLKIFCVNSRLAEQLQQQPQLHYADFVSEYMDVNSTYWSNPPNKEISNHNDLPAGIKDMKGRLSVRRTPSAVHHHYPFGINPALLHANPLFSKFMAAGWGNVRTIPATEAFVLATPVQMVPSYHIPKLCDRSKLPFEQSATPTVLHTPASVSAVLEELKKDPLHKVNPPNKVVLPNLEEPGLNSPRLISGCKSLLHSVSHSGLHRLQQARKVGASEESTEPTESASGPDNANTQVLPSTSSVSVADSAGNPVSAQTLFHVPSALLVSGNGMLLGSSDAPLIDLNPGSATFRLPIVSAPFSQRLNPCMMQAIAFPQIAKVRSVPH